MGLFGWQRTDDNQREAPGALDPGTWNDPADTEQRWGFAGPMCRHGEAGDCERCETECIHGEYGPDCSYCAAMFGS